MRKAVPGVIGVYLLSKQVVQLPLAVLQATSISAVDDPNQPIGLPTIRKGGVSVDVSKKQLLPHRTARACWYTFIYLFIYSFIYFFILFLFYVFYTLSGSARNDFLFLRFYTQRSSYRHGVINVGMLLTMQSHRWATSA